MLWHGRNPAWGLRCVELQLTHTCCDRESVRDSVHHRNEGPSHLTPWRVFTFFPVASLGYCEPANRVKSFHLSSLHGYGGTNQGPKKLLFQTFTGTNRRSMINLVFWIFSSNLHLSDSRCVYPCADFHVLWYFSVSKFRKNERIKLIWWDGAPTTVPLNGYDYCYVCCKYAVAIE
jgi:hypothetical protein